MNLTPSKTYILTILSDFTQEITLIALPSAKVPFYKWKESDGRIFSNRKVDVDIWIKRGILKLKLCQ